MNKIAEIKKLSVSYERSMVLNDISFSIFEKDYIRSVIKADFSCQSHQMRLEMNMNFKKNTLLEVSWIWS